MKYEYGNWFLVAINIIIFMFFVKSVFKPKTRTDWRTYKMFSAFLVALFAEMYGFPLTIYLLTSFFGNRLGIDFSHDSGHIVNKILNISGDPHFSLLHWLSSGLIVGGLLLISSAWNILYKAQKKGTLAATGVYRYIRHPQYAGFILTIVGFLLQWPTLITLVMAPILIIRYILLAKQEEKEMVKKFGSSYEDYKKTTPGFFPSLRIFSKKVSNLVDSSS
ncbi:isoprenylcysteine carboxyl methyltransferase [Candidatus Roizmanbacteria bacterium RIFCSPHIGHO2_01_FULL_39_8]|uniref:Isoprenylcysteine carboxyl methyltransferase n=3 Tax=Candidatus Roizmaniibacteriota TaxID=1752723 RepID=A0A1F7GRX8_9BACT|nr:MAG: isoprenylcysteine carboxyl methyltransferase [Candidatus Roizmanbacteria bacterium RIFCSPHIGHO2_01_FULL_39_8]OGK26014.1 MAG: isoprenylcysteine carboxyl methyltransferase [Candidatus Roizmanbacteria bacterium RIFCSPHIGHO2_02_FULL_39_9]OGK34825.1 MAG: isoprenylcysteine carboxyl methyltransferase [Candidatus Roizmanbacteria bacterium RIFCSPHIGHO2_12_FULL_39_8]